MADSAWATALDASKQAVDAELKFISEADFMRPIRHFDYRPAVQHEFLKLRLAYLQMLSREIDNVVPDPAIDEPS